MQSIRPSSMPERAPLMGVGRALVVGGSDMAACAQGCRDFGLVVELAGEVYDAIADVADDPAGYAAFVLDSDLAGGLLGARRICLWLRKIAPRVAVLLVSGAAAPALLDADYGDGLPIVLGRAATAPAMRYALRHALHDRLCWHAAIASVG